MILRFAVAFQAPRPVGDDAAAGGPLRKGTQSKKVELPPPIIDAGLDGSLKVGQLPSALVCTYVMFQDTTRHSRYGLPFPYPHPQSCSWPTLSVSPQCYMPSNRSLPAYLHRKGSTPCRHRAGLS